MCAMETINAEMLATDEVEQELELCISCLQTNAPGTHFCGHCGTPLTSYAATAPFESILAEGDMWRKAVGQGRWGRPMKWLVLGFVTILLLGFLLGVFVPW
jgi:hypothetical protein